MDDCRCVDHCCPASVRCGRPGVKVILLRRGARELREGLHERLTEETNSCSQFPPGTASCVVWRMRSTANCASFAVNASGTSGEIASCGRRWPASPMICARR